MNHHHRHTLRTLVLGLTAGLMLATVAIAQTPAIEAKKAELDKVVKEMGTAANKDEYDKLLVRYNALNGEIRTLMSDQGSADDKDKACKLSINEANEALRNKDYALAKTSAQKAVSLCPTNPKAHYALGLAADRLGESATAIGSFRKTTELEPDNAKAWYSLGQAYSDAGNRESAIAALTKSGTVDATYAKAWYELGNLFFNSKDFEAAITNYNKATKADDTYYLAWEGLGRTYIEMKDCASAITALEKGLRDKGNKEIAGAWFYLSAAHNQCGSADKALAAVEQCMANLDKMGARKKSIRGGAFYEKGLALEEKGDIAGAKAALNEAKNEREWRDRADWELNRINRK